MMDKSAVESIFRAHKFENFLWIEAKQIRVAQWVRFKCRFGCHCYGKKAVCAPLAPSIAECREFISEYKDVAIFEFAQYVDSREARRAYCRSVNQRFYQLERQLFLAGFYKAFALYCDPCNYCGGGPCVSDTLECVNPVAARPSPEGLGIDVFAAVKTAGYEIKVLKDYTEEMKRYAFMLIE